MIHARCSRLGCNIWFATTHLHRTISETLHTLHAKQQNKRKRWNEIFAPNVIKWAQRRKNMLRGGRKRGTGLDRFDRMRLRVHCLNSMQNVDVCLDCWNSLVYISTMYKYILPELGFKWQPASYMASANNVAHSLKWWPQSCSVASWIWLCQLVFIDHRVVCVLKHTVNSNNYSVDNMVSMTSFV